MKRLSSQTTEKKEFREAESILKKDSFKEAIEDIRDALDDVHDRKLKSELELMEANDYGRAVDVIYEKVLAGVDLTDRELKFLGLLKI